MLEFVGRFHELQILLKRNQGKEVDVTNASILFQVKKGTKSRKNKLAKVKMLRYNCNKSICKNHLNMSVVIFPKLKLIYLRKY